MKIIMLKFCSIFFFLGCSRNIKEISEFKSQREYVINNFNKYDNVYEELTNTVQSHIERRFEEMKGQIGHTYQVDSLIIFNKEKTKLFTTLNTNCKEYLNNSSDLIRGLYGIKIKDKWHIYLGANCIAMRGGYKYNIYEPFTWEELSFVAHDNFFRKYVSFDKKGNIIINHDKVDEYATPWNIGGTAIEHNGTEEENFLKLSEYFESRKIDSIEYQQLLDEVNNAEPKKKDPIYKISWWDKLWGAEVPIFETKEWKDYIKNKSKN